MNIENKEQEFDLPTLHELAMIIKSKQEKIEHLLMPRPHEECMCKYCNAGRLDEQFNSIAEELNIKLTSEIVGLTDTAKQITLASGQKKIEFKGLGTFIFHKNKVKVDDSEYVEFDDVARFNQQEVNPELYNVKTSYNPDKKKILEILKEGGTVDGFKLSAESHTFKFKS